MQIVRTVLWVAIVFALGLFSAFNWIDVDILIWDDLVLTTKLPVLIFAAFLLGLLPMWMVHSAMRWRLKRRIASLEAAQRSLAASQAAMAAPTQADPAETPL